jgi:hypothetical protein
MAEIVAGWLLILLYSPVSSYFSGTGWKPEPSREACLADARGAVGRELDTAWWEKETMGPQPFVVAAFCARGATDAGGDDAPPANLK